MTIAFIPAKKVSVRLPGKNMLALNGHPLLAYAIQSAKDSGIFDEIYVSSDAHGYLQDAEHYGAKGILRPAELSNSDSLDFEWIEHAINHLGLPDVYKYAVLRVTNPFRTGDTIKRAFKTYARRHNSGLKSVSPVSEHPEKMWSVCGTGINYAYDSIRHNLPTQQCQKNIYIQNGCIYINQSVFVSWGGTIDVHITEGYEGLDINTPEDWILAKELYRLGMAKLPEIKGGKTWKR